MAELWEKIVADWPGTTELLDTGFRLLLAIVVGALPGLEREKSGMPAGLRTHILVSLGAAVFMLAALEAGATMGDATRIMQGLATGIGFVGAGAILKSAKNREVLGLTTAANIWLTAALGTAVGAGRISLPLLGSALSLVVLGVLRLFQSDQGNDQYPNRDGKGTSTP
jgi:putative Mg2+ transporter-C (MgtC) family protein